MKNNYILLKDISTIYESNVDKKITDGQKLVKLCNYTDIYNNWAIFKEHENSFMISTATNLEINKFILKKGMIALTKDSEKRNDIGVPTYIYDELDNVLLGYHNALIIPSINIDGSFLNAYLYTNYAKKYFMFQAKGSGQRFSLSMFSIGNLKIYYPTTKIQKKIGKIYVNIAKQIQLNNNIINKLQELSETIYNYWFVQFDFPDEKGRPYKTSGGKMEWNEELGKEIPKDWKVENLCKYNKFYNGYAFKSDTYLPYGKYKLYTIKNIKTNGIDNKICDYIDELPNKMEHNCLLDVGDIVLTLTGHVGRIGIVYEKNALLNQRLLKIKTEYPLFMYLLFKNSEINKQIIKQANGTSQKNLSPLSLANIYYACPNLELLLLFSQKYGYIYNMMTNLMQEIQELNSLRDFLLPLLMNGQVGFKESED